MEAGTKARNQCVMVYSLSSAARHSRGFGLIAAGQLAAVVAGFAIVKAIAMLPSKEDAAQTILALSVAPFALQMIFSPLAIAASKYRRRAIVSGFSRDYIRACKRLFLVGTCLFLLMLVAGIGFAVTLERISLLELLILSVACLYALLFAFQSTLLALDNAAEKRGRVAFFGLFTAALRIMSAGAAVLYWESGLGILSSLALAYLITSLIQWNTGDFKGRAGQVNAKRQRQYLKSMLAFSLPMLIWGIPAAVHLVADRWSLATFSSPDVVASYGVLYGIGYTPAVLAGTVLSSTVWPMFLRKEREFREGAGQKLRGTAFLITFTVCAMGLCAAALVVPFARQLVGVLGDHRYAAAADLLPLLIAAGAFNAALQLLSGFLLATRGSNNLLAPKIGFAVIGTVLIIAGASYGNAKGAAVGLLLGNVFGLGMFLFVSRLPKASGKM